MSSTMHKSPQIKGASNNDSGNIYPAARLKAIDETRKKMNNAFFFRLYLIAKLPIAWIAGMRLRMVEKDKCTTSIPYKWLSQNPFNSVYFATQAMAAELSTGTIAILAVSGTKPSVAMLITKMEAEYTKKATETVFYTCSEGDLIFKAADEAIKTGQGQEITVQTVGKFKDGTEVARFKFTWSFKARA